MKLKYKIEIKEVADMFVGVATDFETGDPQKTFRLNETGVTIIKALQDGDDEEAIVAKLLNEFIVDEATAKAETTNFLKMLVENGLLRDDAVL